MRTIPSSVTAEVQKDSIAPVTLLTGYLTNTTVMLCDSDVSVVSSGQTFDPYPFVVGEVEITAEDRTKSVEVSLTNVGYLVSSMIQGDTLQGKRITIEKIYRPHMDDRVMELDGMVNGVKELTEERGTFELVSEVSGLRKTMPRNFYYALCRWDYSPGGDSICQVNSNTYVQSYGTCDKTWASCQSRTNTHRFGGYFV